MYKHYFTLDETKKERGFRFYVTCTDILNDIYDVDYIAMYLENGLIEIKFLSKYEKEFIAKVKVIVEEIENRKIQIQISEDRRLLEAEVTSYCEAKQGEYQWRVDRIGLLTGSNHIFKMNGDLIPTWKEVVLRNASEAFQVLVLGEDIAPNVSTKAMGHGHELEPLIANEYTRLTGEALQEIPLAVKGDLKIGASLDRLLVNNPKKAIEIKAPASLVNYFRHVTEEHYLIKHFIQIQIQMLVCDLEEVDLVVGYPNMNLQITNVKRSDKIITKILTGLKEYDAEYNRIMKVFRSQMM